MHLANSAKERNTQLCVECVRALPLLAHPNETVASELMSTSFRAVADCSETFPARLNSATSKWHQLLIVYATSATIRSYGMFPSMLNKLKNVLTSLKTSDRRSHAQQLSNTIKNSIITLNFRVRECFMKQLRAVSVYATQNSLWLFRLSTIGERKCEIPETQPDCSLHQRGTSTLCNWFRWTDNSAHRELALLVLPSLSL